MKTKEEQAVSDALNDWIIATKRLRVAKEEKRKAYREYRAAVEAARQAKEVRP
jgi:hypothetical protein